MFNLYFFSENDPEVAFNIKDGKADRGEYVKDGTFNTKEEALNRLDNIGSRWIFYPNACIIEGLDELKNKCNLIGIYMADGFSYILQEKEHVVFR